MRLRGGGDDDHEQVYNLYVHGIRISLEDSGQNNLITQMWHLLLYLLICIDT